MVQLLTYDAPFSSERASVILISETYFVC